MAAEVAFFERLLATVDGEDSLADVQAMPAVRTDLIEDVVRWLGRAVSEADDWSMTLRTRGDDRKATFVDAGTAAYRDLIDNVRAWPRTGRQ